MVVITLFFLVFHHFFIIFFFSYLTFMKLLTNWICIAHMALYFSRTSEGPLVAYEGKLTIQQCIKCNKNLS